MSLEARIRELSERHKRIDAAIAAEMKHPAGDDVRIHDLKRQKLRIKDDRDPQDELRQPSSRPKRRAPVGD